MEIPTMARMNKLNVRQQKFVLGLFEGKSAMQSYADAGYKLHPGNSSRLTWYDTVQAELTRLRAEAAKKCEVTVESLFEELEQARQKATDLNQLSAAVRATGEKIKLSGLAVQKVEISQSQFTDDMTIQEILDEVIAERGIGAGYYLAKAYGLNPAEYGIKFIEGEVIAGEEIISEGKRKHREIRGVSAVSVDFGKPISQRAIEEAKPVSRKRDIR